jgi:hypothetical protein
MSRTRALLGLILIAVLSLSAVACDWDALTPEQQASITAALQRRTQHTPPGGFLACVRQHESRGDYTAKNPSSSASGAYQYLDSTWRTVSAAAGHGGYPSARSAPPHVQDAVAEFHVATYGKSAWNGTGC